MKRTYPPVPRAVEISPVGVVSAMPAAPPAQTHGARILHAEDDGIVRELCLRIFIRAGYTVVSVADGVDAWLAAQKQDFDLVVTDHDMPRCTGYELVTRLRHAHIHWPVMVTTANPDPFATSASEWLDIACILEKPFSLQDLRSSVEGIVWGQNTLVAS